MKAVMLRAVDGPLIVEDVPEPDGSPRVEVRAAGLNFADVLVRQGRYPQMPALPHIPGSEIAGDLDGRRVMVFLGASAGGFAQRVVVDPLWVFDMPPQATYEEGAAFLMTYLTAWIALAWRVRIERGQTVLVHAGAGGVGSAAIQIARHLGARVIATAGSEEKRKVALDLGAEEVYSYEDFGKAVRADHVLDPVGGAVFVDSISALNLGGQLIAIGFASGHWEDVNPALIVGRNIGIHGLYVGRMAQRQPELVREATAQLIDLWQQGVLKPFVGARYEADRADDAFAHVETRASVGKVVLTF